MATGVKQVGGGGGAKSSGGGYGREIIPGTPQEPRLREGSPWAGLKAVFLKEFADQLTSARMLILEVLVVTLSIFVIYRAADSIRTNVSSDPFLYLKLFTTGVDPVPSLVGFLGILVPLIALIMIFDSVNGEFNKRTMSRVLAQPIYRDALLLGKFLAGLATLALVFTALWLLVFGMGLLRLGVVPGLEESGRILLILVATIFYGGIWLALGLVFSVAFRSPATAVLAGASIWFLMVFLWSIPSSLMAQNLAPVTSVDPMENLNQQVTQANLELTFERMSPNTLYSEVLIALLNPEARQGVGIGLLTPDVYQGLQGAVLTPLPLGQSLLLVWPQLTTLISGTILLYALAYVLFQRQEIRA